MEAARAQALGSRYAKDVVDLSLASLTTQTYFSLRSLDAQIATTRNTLTTRNDGLALVKRRVDAGYASDLDLRQAEGATHRRVRAAEGADPPARDGRAPARRADRQARSRRRARRGIALLPQPALPPPGLPSTLLERRPDVRLAEQNLIAENALIGVAVARQFPTISLTGNYGGESAALASLFSGPGRIWAVGVGLTTPIFDAGKLAALADAERARYKQALATYEQTIQTSFRDVADALTNVAQYRGDGGRPAGERQLGTRSAASREPPLRSRLLRVSRSAGLAAHGQPQRALADPQPAGAARCRRRPDDGAGRRLAARGNHRREIDSPPRPRTPPRQCPRMVQASPLYYHRRLPEVPGGTSGQMRK